MGVRSLGADTLDRFLDALVRRVDQLDRRLTILKEWLSGNFSEVDHEHDFEIDVEQEGVPIGGGNTLNFVSGENTFVGVSDAGNTVTVSIDSTGGTTTQIISAEVDYVLVASAIAPLAIQEVADYLCDGIDDQDEIQLATTQAAVEGKYVKFTQGTFNLSLESAVGPDTLWQGFSPGIMGSFPTSLSTSSYGTIFNIDILADGVLPINLPLGAAIDSIAFFINSGAFTTQMMVDIDAAVLNNCVFGGDSTVLTDSYMQVGAFDNGESVNLTNLKFYSFPTSTIPAIRFTGFANGFFNNIKVRRFNAPAIVIDADNANYGAVISDITHLLVEDTATFDYVVEDNSTGSGNAIDCASIFTDKAADGVLPSNLCSDPNPGSS